MENLDAAEVTLLVALVGAWSVALIMIAGVVIRDIVRAWRGTDAQGELTVERQPGVDPARWDLATGDDQGD